MLREGDVGTPSSYGNSKARSSDADRTFETNRQSEVGIRGPTYDADIFIGSHIKPASNATTIMNILAKL